MTFHGNVQSFFTYKSLESKLARRGASSEKKNPDRGSVLPLSITYPCLLLTLGLTRLTRAVQNQMLRLSPQVSHLPLRTEEKTAVRTKCSDLHIVREGIGLVKVLWACGVGDFLIGRLF